MVMPKLPFTLFDFDRMSFFGVKNKVLESAAGVAIPTTTIYTVPEHKMALLLNLKVQVAKTTATELLVRVIRKEKDETLDTSEALIRESAADNYFSWPSGKTAGAHVFGWHLLFLFEGDAIDASQALTAAETIKHTFSWLIIEYDDPRYEK